MRQISLGGKEGLMKLAIILVLLIFFSLFSNESSGASLRCPKPTDNEKENKEIGRKYFQMGEVYFRQKRFQEAIQSFECVLSIIPYSMNTRFLLAKTLEKSGKYVGALKEYKFILDSIEKDDRLYPEVSERVRVLSTQSKVEPSPQLIDDSAEDLAPLDDRTAEMRLLSYQEAMKLALRDFRDNRYLGVALGLSHFYS